jgi:hypothetical protein
LAIKISQSPAHGTLASSSLMRATEAEDDTPLRMHDLNFNPDEDQSYFCCCLGVEMPRSLYPPLIFFRPSDDGGKKEDTDEEYSDMFWFF